MPKKSLHHTNEHTPLHVTAVVHAAHSSFHQGKHKQTSYADSQLAEEYQWGQEQLSHRNTNYTFYVIMQRYKERED